MFGSYSKAGKNSGFMFREKLREKKSQYSVITAKERKKKKVKKVDPRMACFKSLSRDRRALIEGSRDVTNIPPVGKYNNNPKRRIRGGYISQTRHPDQSDFLTNLSHKKINSRDASNNISAAMLKVQKIITEPICEKLLGVISGNTTKNSNDQSFKRKFHKKKDEEEKRLNSDESKTEVKINIAKKPKSAHQRKRLKGRAQIRAKTAWQDPNKTGFKENRTSRDFRKNGFDAQKLKYENNISHYGDFRNTTSPTKYNLVISSKDRYLEVASSIGPKGVTSHIPGVDFDKIIKRDSFLNSGPDVNEKRFELLKTPESWNKYNNNFQVIRVNKTPKEQSQDTKDYNPNKEPTMQKLNTCIPNFKLNKDFNRTGFLNLCKEPRPEVYEIQKAREKLTTVKSFSIKRSCKRDLKMYKQTEAYANIQNENEKYDYIRRLMSS
ncbi:unnamed protein product [Moneuplotes crassus]|uniref:Uncharacterized protein n=1 Tax=Euplotes crassus TaxID=5936 RepID=A0AAD1ULE4_EUPCR|nr:unnamed protein product [Moneuplotes crassus]